MTYKDLNDIEREKREKARQEMTDRTTQMVDKIINQLEDNFKRRQIQKEKQKPTSRKILDIIIAILIILILLDLLLGGVWLLKFFIKSLFNIQ